MYKLHFVKFFNYINYSLKLKTSGFITAIIILKKLIRARMSKSKYTKVDH